MKKLLLISLVLAAGCAMPATTVRSLDTRPSISISQATESAELFVDGVRMGMANEFQEPRQLNLEPGTHRVTVVDNGKVSFERTIFVESEHKNIIAR
jgi:hypothetical protein